MATKPSFAAALRMAKQVKMQNASGADGSFVRMTADDKMRLYEREARKQGETEVDIRNRLQYTNFMMKDIFG